MRQKFIAGCCAGIVMCLAGAAQGQTLLRDFNTSATFQGGNQINWIVDGVGHLFNQRFFFRTSTMTDEVPVDSLTLTGSQASDTNPFDDTANDTLSLRYAQSGGLEFRISYLLRGGTPGSGTADLAETIRISNPTSAPISLSFFQYVDFDLAGSASNDFAQVLNANAVRQWDNSGFTIAETVVTPGPSGFQVGTFPSIIGLFGNGVADNLNNTAGIIGPTDASWAFQWDVTVLPGGSFTISKDKLITVPAPAGVAMLGLAGVIATRRRRSR